jgi:hypothetical protein
MNEQQNYQHMGRSLT